MILRCNLRYYENNPVRQFEDRGNMTQYSIELNFYAFAQKEKNSRTDKTQFFWVCAGDKQRRRACENCTQKKEKQGKKKKCEELSFA